MPCELRTCATAWLRTCATAWQPAGTQTHTVLLHPLCLNSQVLGSARCNTRDTHKGTCMSNIQAANLSQTLSRATTSQSVVAAPAADPSASWQQPFQCWYTFITSLLFNSHAMGMGFDRASQQCTRGAPSKLNAPFHTEQQAEPRQYTIREAAHNVLHICMTAGYTAHRCCHSETSPKSSNTSHTTKPQPSTLCRLVLQNDMPHRSPSLCC